MKSKHTRALIFGIAVSLLALYFALKNVGFSSLADSVLSAAPGFFGTVQLAFVLALVPYGVSESDALAGFVIFHVISYFYVMISGVIALHQLNMSVTELRRDV